MTHDPLCPSYGLCDCGCEYDAHCMCGFIAKVRADERAKVIATIETLAVRDVDGVMYIGERLDHILEAVSLGGIITPDMPAPQIVDARPKTSASNV